MSYQVIARKYRPQQFADVVGQEHVTQTLVNAIQKQRIAHAYLFCGPRGTGKTTVARIFAKALNCTGGPKADFDVNDPKCVEIAEGRSLDVLEIDGASNNGVEQVRELRETCRFAPASSRFKIYIIDEVHMLTAAAFNALLKTLEEPPAHVKFMFATTDPEKVLPTILSRCQRFDLRRIPSSLIVKHLQAIATQEGVRVEEAALHAIARGADGGMRDAESTLDQLISFCGGEIAEADVLAMFGMAAQGQILALADALIAGDAARLLSELDELARNGKELGRLLSDLLNHFRNLLIFQVSRGDRRLLEVSEAEAGALASQSQKLPADAVSRVMEVLTDAEGRLRDAVSKKIALEVALLRAMQVRHAVSIDTVLTRLRALREEGNPGTPPPLTPPGPDPSSPRPAQSSEPVKAAAVAAAPEPRAVRAEVPQTGGSSDGAGAMPSAVGRAAETTHAPTAATGTMPEPVELHPPAGSDTNAVSQGASMTSGLAEIWAALVNGVAVVSPFLKLYLQKAFPVALDRELLTIGFPASVETPLSLVDNARNRALIAETLKAAGLKAPEVKFVRCDPPPAGANPPPAVPTADAVTFPAAVPVPAAPAPAPPLTASPPAVSAEKPAPAKPATARPTKLDPASFKDDPQIAAALAAFRGRIVQVVAPNAQGT